MDALVRKQGAWGLWWLVLVTLSIYYFIWYARINRELCAVSGVERPANGTWWNQLIPFWNIVGLWATANRLNATNAALGSPTRVGPFMTAILSPMWFGSHTRYVQRRMNGIHDVMGAKSAG